jgi:y4mF family transcriptional regulator
MQMHIKMDGLAEFVKNRRKKLKLTQEEFAERAGVALTVIRKIEQGKENLSVSKVNQVLKMFGFVLGPIKTGYETGNN